MRSAETYDYTLSLDKVAWHWRLGRRTVREMIRDGRLPAVRVGGQLRLCWRDVWRCEAGAMPARRAEDDYRRPLLTKKDVAASLAVSTRSVERLIAQGLPTRKVGQNTRIAPRDLEDWLDRQRET
ncbi:helix-turn-helix domain-containing protein [Pontivivens ytuae]|uniref:Helix-turn-helix domain-containing protein n=1 Tax=Pontivivens ytuae TaxID=2789856 RepID=A0A7S9LQP7_9RHOB|nr:helix-turn-helix domain-containing protein [Pontivivens ytuae]QPH53230.1 helix-turn-helix domain-containing protein [Pontivivens ytuae]